MSGGRPTASFADFGSSARGSRVAPEPEIYIHDDIYHQVIQRVIDVIPTFRIGDPLDDATQVGAIISKEQLARVERYVALARSTPGGKVLSGGARPSVSGFENGYFYSTTLIEGLRQGIRRLPQRDFRTRCDRIALE